MAFFGLETTSVAIGPCFSTGGLSTPSVLDFGGAAPSEVPSQRPRRTPDYHRRKQRNDRWVVGAAPSGSGGRKGVDDSGVRRPAKTQWRWQCDSSSWVPLHEQQSGMDYKNINRYMNWALASVDGSTVMRKARMVFQLFLTLLGVRSALYGKRQRTHRNVVGREGGEAEQTPVLTSKICLIPGDKAVVRIEDAPGNARRIFTGIDIRASVDQVWSVMTNYDSLMSVVPNLAQNKVLKPLPKGGARLWQIGKASWKIMGRSFFFQAGTTLDVKLYPEGMSEAGVECAGKLIDASTVNSDKKVRDHGKRLGMVRDVFPRPFSIQDPGVPVSDITMQNVVGERGDFVHYQGVWRLQPLDGCTSQHGETMMRLSFALECQPHWFLPVAPVEGRIATALMENMEAIRDHVEKENAAERLRSRKQMQRSTDHQVQEDHHPQSVQKQPHHQPAHNDHHHQPVQEELFAGMPSFASLLSTSPSTSPACNVQAQRDDPQKPRPAFGSTLPRGTFQRGLARLSRTPGRQQGTPRGSLLRRRAFIVPDPAFTTAMEDALVRAEMRLFEQPEIGTAVESLNAAMPGTVEMSATGLASGLETALAGIGIGTEIEQVVMATALVAFAGWNTAAKSVAGAPPASAEQEPGVAETGPQEKREVDDETLEWLSALIAAESSADGDDAVAFVLRAILEQHADAVRGGEFLGIPVPSRQGLAARWDFLRELLDVSEDRLKEIVEVDACPLLVQSEDVASVFSQLVAISSKETARELVGKNPSLLVGRAAARERLGYNSTIMDIMYSGRLQKLLQDEKRSNEDKVEEIERYSTLTASLKPLVEIVRRGLTLSDASAATRRLFRTLRQLVTNDSLRVLLGRCAAAADPWAYLTDQTTAGISMAGKLATRPSLPTAILPHARKIVPHMPSIYTRLSILGPHVPGIVQILDEYLDVVEPHLDRIMERLDEIEPHLPYILLHLDILAPHCGTLLDHFDELMPFAEDKTKVRQVGRRQVGRDLETMLDCYAREQVGGSPPSLQKIKECMFDSWDEGRPATDVEREEQRKSYLPKLLPYVDFLVPHLDDLAPHLKHVHRHIPHLLPFMDKLLPYVMLFVPYPQASKNADVLVGYFGFLLKFPFLTTLLNVPMVPRVLATLSGILPRRPIRWVLERRLRRYEDMERLSLA
eukprot:TRINITY_DN55673_c0_g1_i1.p1 TRINITY_DN55673_c0_g1~~TRINITY_DN55673_c0_g1_i1.p1  ORF type:complete len:1163 (+),score=194.39 TRINITY_DN55673_c0_g1_i1:109-3597(+)